MATTLTTARSAVIYVNGNGATPPYTGQTWEHAFINIQDGVNAALSDDEVWVAYGQYIERITLKSGVKLYGGFMGVETQLSQRLSFPRSTPDPYETQVDANYEGAVVTAVNVTGGLVDGFTLQAGNASGGVNLSKSTPAIMNCTITINQGHGIACYDNSNATVSENTIHLNTGYGVYCRQSSSPTIASNTISGNSIGVYCESYCDPSITSNSISGNKSDGVYCYNSDPVITNNVISSNLHNGVYRGEFSIPIVSYNTISGNSHHGIRFEGGWSSSDSPTLFTHNIVSLNKQDGIHCSVGNPTISNNRITDNLGNGLYHSGAYSVISNNLIARNMAGGVVGYQDSGVGKIVNCTIVSNQGDGLAFTGNGQFMNNIIAFNIRGLVRTSGTTMPGFRNNDVYGNLNGSAASDYVGIDDQTGRAGNIKADPLFFNRATGDFHLNGGPCVNKGYNGAVEAGALDLDNTTRIQNVTVDMGCYETGTVTPPLSLVFSVQPGGATALMRLNPQPVLSVLDATGALVNYTGSVTIAIKTGTGTNGAVLKGGTTIPITTGQARFGNLAIDLPGSGYVLTATSDSLPPVDSQPIVIPLYPWGDTNHDGVFDLRDVTYHLRVWAGLDQPT